MGPGAAGPLGPLLDDWLYATIVEDFFKLSTVPFSIVTVLFRRAIGFEVFNWDSKAAKLLKRYIDYQKMEEERSLQDCSKKEVGEEEAEAGFLI